MKKTTKKLTTEEFINRARKIHGDKYDYSQSVYVNARSKVIIICPEHGKFCQTPDCHTNMKQGCPKCQSSKKEIIIRKILHNNGYKYKEQKTFKDCINSKTNRRLKYDFYLPDKNMLVEYNGKQHYQYIKRWHQNHQSLESQQYRDNIKKQYALSHGYRFLVIKYNENIEEKLKETLQIKSS